MIKQFGKTDFFNRIGRKLSVVSVSNCFWLCVSGSRLWACKKQGQFTPLWFGLGLWTLLHLTIDQIHFRLDQIDGHPLYVRGFA